VSKPVRGFPSDGPKIVNAVDFLLLVDVALIHLGRLPLTLITLFGASDEAVAAALLLICAPR
jgi:hypothetical protein